MEHNQYYGMPLAEDVYERGASLRELYVPTARTSEARQRLMDFHEAGRMSPEKRCFFLSGPAGTGKSRILKAFIDEDIAKASSAGKVAYVEVPSPCTIKSVSESILEALKDPYAHLGTTAMKSKRIGARLREEGYTLLIFDEAQHMVETKNMKVISAVADWLKMSSLLNSNKERRTNGNNFFIFKVLWLIIKIDFN